MRCFLCNPMCGMCQPAPKKSATCPDCGTCTIFDRNDIIAGIQLVCKKCGKDMTEDVRPKPITCNYSGLVCAYPCGKGVDSHCTNGFQVCMHNTPPEACGY